MMLEVPRSNAYHFTAGQANSCDGAHLAGDEHHLHILKPTLSSIALACCQPLSDSHATVQLMHPKLVARPHLAAWPQPWQQRLHDQHWPKCVDIELPHDDVPCHCLQRVDLLDAGRHHQQVYCWMPDGILQLRRVALRDVVPCNKQSAPIFRLRTRVTSDHGPRCVQGCQDGQVTAGTALHHPLLDSPVMHSAPAASSWLLGPRTVPTTV